MRSAPRQRLSAGQRRESILRAAVQVFTAHGYRAAKVSDVAREVGVTEPVIFQNFGSKAALYAAVLERAAADIRADLQATGDEHASAAELLVHVLSPGPARGQRLPSHALLFMDAAGLAAEPALKGPARRALRAVAGHLADLVGRAQSDGDVDAHVDPDAAAWLVLSVLAGRATRATAMPHRDRLEPGVSGLVLGALGIDKTDRGRDPRPRRGVRHRGG